MMKIKLRMPILPMNINKIISIFPKLLSSGVIPIDNPQVPKAEATSKKISINENFSVTDNKKIEIKQVKKANSVTISDFLISSSCISRLNTLIDLFPLAKWKRYKILIANVVVRIPPPTELGDAPINIIAPKNNKVGSEKSFTSIVAKPALLVVTDWNKEKKKVSCQSIPLKK